MGRVKVERMKRKRIRIRRSRPRKGIGIVQECV